MADQLDEIRNKIDLVEFINESVPLKKAGRNFKAICPFHSETAPSFIVSPERQIWKCFGCGEGGDHFGFLMKFEGLEFGEALQILAKRAGVRLRAYKPSEGEKVKQLLYEINHLASEYYHYLLLNHPAAKRGLDYILGRGITKPSLQLFKLGFAPNRWDSLQKFLVGKKGYRADDLEKAGLVIKSPRQSGYYDRFRGRLMFTLKDHRGNVAGFAGRTLETQPAEAKYVNTPETLIYHKSDLLYGLTETKAAIKKADSAILVEGELDLISSYQAGVKNVVAIKGSALTDHQVRLLKRFTQNLVFALDRDVAGDVAAKRGIEVADAVGMAIKVINLEGGKDPDEVAQKNPRLWQKLVKEAMPVYDYFFVSALSRFDAQTAEGKRQISQALLPVVAKISNEIVRSHYLARLAEELDVSQEVVNRELVKIKPGELRKTGLERESSQKMAKPGRQELLEEHLLGLVFQTKRWEWLRKRKLASLIQTKRFARILEVAGQYFKRYKTFESGRLVKMLPAELEEVFNQFYLLDFGDLISHEETLTKELEKTLQRLEELDLRENLEAISREMRTLERKKKLNQSEEKKLETLSRKFRDLSEKLAALELKK